MRLRWAHVLHQDVLSLSPQLWRIMKISRPVSKLMSLRKNAFLSWTNFRRKSQMEEKVSQEADEREEIKIVDGVYERRYFLQGIMAAATATALSYTVRASHLAEPFVNNGSMSNPGTLSWDEFNKQAVPVAQQLVADPGYSVDEYLFRIGSLAT